MGLFSRRRPTTPAPASEDTRRAALLAVMPVSTHPVTTAGVGGQAGWAPLGGNADPSQQIGRYNGTVLSQYPANIPGAQKHSGVEWRNVHYYQPAATHGGAAVTATQRGSSHPGTQRYGITYGGPSGPLNVQAMKERLVIAQTRASGAQVLGWARKLDPNYTGD